MDLEWPTLWLFLAVVLVFSFSTYLGFTKVIPATLAVIINTAAVYSSFTVMHEASHKNISRKYPRLEYALGLLSGLLFHGAYEQFISIHLRHHAKVNIHGEDPDLHAAGPLGILKLFAWGLTLFVYSKFFWKKDMFQKRRAWGIILPYVFILALYFVGHRYSFIPALLTFWLLPSFLGVMLTVFVFDHLPHRPHTDTGKYTNASFYPRKGIDWLVFMQSHHLVHHLWPSVPWYRYRECYAQKRDELLAAGSIEH